MKVVFFGTSDYCLPILEVLTGNYDLKLVVTQPDRPIGRKKVITPSATKAWASKNNIAIETPKTLQKDSPDRMQLERLLKSICPNLAIIADYGLIIPEKIFQIPKFGTLNIHFSKLPDLRGPAPVQYTLLRGDSTAWITVFRIDEHMDTGPTLWQQTYPIFPDDTTETLYRRLFVEAAKEIPGIISGYVSGKTKLIPQNHSKATYSRLITKQDGFVGWEDLQKGGQKIYNRFRAMTPWPGLWSINPRGKRMIVRKCRLKDGKLVLDETQIEGKTPVAHSDFPH